MASLRFIDFFAGIGGFRLGMEMAGHICVGHCEIDEYANKSYVAMHKPRKDEWFARDIRTVNPTDLPDAEVYCFGFPCQAFSLAGLRRGFEDTRGTLFFEVMRLAKEKHPDLLFAENVRGLLNHDKGRTFATILKAMDELGYDAEWQVCNSKHFGVPQNRERLFIVGHYRGGKFTEPILPLSTSYTKTDELKGQVISNTIANPNRLTGGIYPLEERERERANKNIPQDQRLSQRIAIGDYRYDEGLRIRNGIAPTIPAHQYREFEHCLSGVAFVIESTEHED